MDTEALHIRVHGEAELPTLIYLPGLHGDWTLVSSFRERMKARVRFVEFTYPRTLDWSLEDYARAVLDVLRANGIREGTLLAESFGSQVAWVVLGQSASGFQPTKLILAGGFVRYPCMPLVDGTRAIWRVLPDGLVRLFFQGYAVFARWRHRRAPETAAAIKEFVARRTPLDLAAMGHRLKLIRLNDPAFLAGRVEIPVYQLTGFWDPVVYYPAVRASLRRLCPGYRETRIVSSADHNVLGTAPEPAANLVATWLAE